MARVTSLPSSTIYTSPRFPTGSKKSSCARICSFVHRLFQNLLFLPVFALSFAIATMATLMFALTATAAYLESTALTIVSLISSLL